MSVKEIDVELAFQMQSKGNLLIDVREQHEWDVAHATGATHFPKSKLPKFEKNFSAKNKPYILICQRGVRSKIAADFLVDVGYTNIYSVTGGFSDWEEAKLPVTTETS